MTSLLKRMAEVYHALRSYADEGVVVQSVRQGDTRTRKRMTFRTAFVRPYRFRYEFNDGETGQRLVISQLDPPAKFLWSADGSVSTLGLSGALARATGISRGSAVTIPVLLLPGLLESWSLTDIEDARESGEEVHAGARCLRIDGFQGGSPVAVWLDAQELMVRRILQAQHFGKDERASLLAELPEDLRSSAETDLLSRPDFDTETETSYVPRKNIALGDHDFAP